METLYRNRSDTRRYRIYQRIPRDGFRKGEWDVDVWLSPDRAYSFASVSGEAFATKADARTWAERDARGPLTPLSARTHPECTSHWRAK